MTNLWTRQQNKRAKQKKEHAKSKHASSLKSVDALKQWISKTAPEDAVMGVVASVHKNLLEVVVNGKTFQAKLAKTISAPGRLDFVVGDRAWVKLDKDGNAMVVGRAERTSFIGRSRGDDTRFSISDRHVLAANVDIGVITASLKNPDLFPQYIDRYLVLLEDGGVVPVICLTKCDLTDDRPEFLEHYKSMGIPIIQTSTILERGIDSLKKILTHKTAVFVGQSGVGKSSLVKMLDPSLEIATQPVREKTGEGKHTTTKSNLYEWAEDSFIIDTPGIRSLGINNIPKDQIKFMFPDFSELATQCKYHDCLHLTEPDCAIRQSIQNHDGKIDERRYESYLNMVGGM